ncbi:MAG: AAA family ATPase [Candidatus Diapherotrites archaeon]|nr:AAA family ATPase [Candidatus Diapherotrites archaeon]
MIGKVPTGIDGFDDMVKGGFLEKRHILLTGGPGTGKTTFAMQFLYNGAKTFKEKGLYISLEETPEKLLSNLKQSLKWDLDKHIKDGSLVIATVDKFDWSNLSDILQSYITRHGVKRVVIDPLTIMRMNTKDEFEFRRNLIGLLAFLENLDCTVLITAELPTVTREATTYSLEEFIVDGVVVLYNLPIKNERRFALEVLKMRGVNHSKSMYPFKITDKGIVVYPEEII